MSKRDENIDERKHLCQNFTGLSVTGGFVWNLGILQQAGYTLAQYAQAIINGLAKTCS